jgi:hypothetical protein
MNKPPNGIGREVFFHRSIEKYRDPGFKFVISRP